MAAALEIQAEDISFPPEAGVVNVTHAPYFARGDGVADDTAAIQQALSDHGNANRIIYLPNGTYRISDTLVWPGGANDESRQRNTILQGQSREGTLLRLADFAPGYANSGHPRPMIWTGDSPGTRPRNAIRNLTVHTGNGNPGTVGIQFFANRQGGIRDVSIVAGGNGSGVVGLDLAHAEQNGPAFFSGLRVSGFDFGIRASGSVYSLTFDGVVLTGQRIAGMRNSGQVVNLRRLVSTNSVSAIQNYDSTSFLTVLDSTCVGTLGARRQDVPAMNRGTLFARSVNFPGYTNFLENRAGNRLQPETQDLTEFLSHDPYALFPSITNSLNLPVMETPDVPWDPLPAWSGPHRFGAKPGVGIDCSQALQQAIDSGAPTVCFPNGVWTLNQTVTLRGSVRRVIGCEARIILNLPPGAPAFRIEDGTPPVVVFERLEVAAGKGAFLFEKSTRRTLVIRDCSGVQGRTLPGNGDLFLENVSSGGPWVFERERVFARQFHIAYEGTKILNTNATVWIFGLTTELPGTLIRTAGGGKTELLGGLCVSSGAWKSDPMFVVEDSQATFQIAEASLSRAPYQTLVSETRRGETLRLSNKGPGKDSPMPERLGGILLPFFTAQPQR
jgi:hypothetical protein